MSETELIAVWNRARRDLILSQLAPTALLGFSILLLSSFVPVRHFGELIAVTVALSLLATLVVQPALLSVAGLSRSVRAAHREEDARIVAAVRQSREAGAGNAPQQVVE